MALPPWCSGGDWSRPSDPSLLDMTRELIIGSTRSWAQSVATFVWEPGGAVRYN